MRIISFGYTWPALISGAKSCTRRQWKHTYAARFNHGEVVLAYDRDPRYGGQPVARLQLTARPKWESMREMPDSDYEAEGFAWFAEHPGWVSASARDQIWGACTREAFEAWRQSGGWCYVMRFKVVEVFTTEKEAG
jgi:hypothetical protein